MYLFIHPLIYLPIYQGHLPVVLEADGPVHYCINDVHRMTGKSKLKQTLLKAQRNRWAAVIVVSLNYWMSAKNSKTRKRALLEAKFAEEGLDLEVYRYGQGSEAEISCSLSTGQHVSLSVMGVSGGGGGEGAERRRSSEVGIDIGGEKRKIAEKKGAQESTPAKRITSNKQAPIDKDVPTNVMRGAMSFSDKSKRKKTVGSSTRAAKEGGGGKEGTTTITTTTTTKRKASIKSTANVPSSSSAPQGGMS